MVSAFLLAPGRREHDTNHLAACSIACTGVSTNASHPQSEYTLEIKLCTKLDNAETSTARIRVRWGSPIGVLRNGQGVGRTRVGPRPRHRRAIILVIEVRMIEGVERFQAKLQGARFAQRNVLEQRHIPVLHSAAAQRVTSSPQWSA